MTLLDQVHGRYVHGRRVQVLFDCLSGLIPDGSSVLDVGCGDGLLASLIADQRKDLKISGIDVLVRNDTKIPVEAFDGKHLPLPDKSVDVIMFVDVLHHTEDPMVLLREAARVASKALVIKDHRLNGWLAGPTLRFMDWIGNARHAVALPYNYWPEERWLEAFSNLKLSVGYWSKDFKLYPGPASLVFDRSLHFLARLNVGRNQ